MLRNLAKIVMALSVVCALPAHALGLGEIDVNSKLNQKFYAFIPVLGASAEDLSTLEVRLANPDDFDRAGIERADYLSSLEFTMQKYAGGAAVVVTSSQIDHEPFLNFLVEARWQGGKLQREYTVLLDPPGVNVAVQSAQSSPVPVSSAQAVNPESAPVSSPSESFSTPAEPRVSSAVPASSTSVASAVPFAPASRHTRVPAQTAAAVAPVADIGTTSSYGPIDSQETLWSIAEKLRPPSATMDQTLLALYDGNRTDFDAGRFNGLLRGVTLTVPSAADIESVSPEAAKARVDQLRHGGGSAAPAETAAPTSPTQAAKKNVSADSTAAAAALFAPASSSASAPAASASSSSTAAIAPTKPTTPSAASAPSSSTSPISSTAAPSSATPTPTGAAASATGGSPTTIEAVPAGNEAARQSAATAPAGSSAGSAAAAAPAPAQASPEAATSAPVDSTPGSANVPKTVVPPPAATTTSDSSFLDDYQLPLFALLIVLLIGFLGWRLSRGKDRASKSEPSPSSSPLPSFRAKAPTAKAPPPPVPVAVVPPVSATRPPASISQAPQTPAFGADTLGKLAPYAAQASTTTVSAPPPKPHDDFDVAAPSAAKNVAVSADANDPLSEADFHIAYGLYDEAASLLKQGLVKTPGRLDLQTKLCETYFAAGKPVEFQEAAEALHGKVSPADWDRIAAMGQQIAPDASLFRSGDSVTPPSTFQSTPAPQAMSQAPSARPAFEHSLDFNLDDLNAPAIAKPTPAPAVNPVIDFNFDDQMHSTSAASSIAPSMSTSVPTSQSSSTPAHDFGTLDLSHFDLDMEPAAAAVSHSTIDQPLEFNLDELDLNTSTPPSATSTDEIGTKLDLARAYADMGENDAAGDLIRDVIGAGTPAQRQEAEALAKRLISA